MSPRGPSAGDRAAIRSIGCGSPPCPQDAASGLPRQAVSELGASAWTAEGEYTFRSDVTTYREQRERFSSTVHLRYLHVHEHQVEGPGLEVRDRFQAVGGERDVVSPAPEKTGRGRGGARRGRGNQGAEVAKPMRPAYGPALQGASPTPREGAPVLLYCARALPFVPGTNEASFFHRVHTGVLP
jgi:hypothetical protein